jgi:hypothetical protein
MKRVDVLSGVLAMLAVAIACSAAQAASLPAASGFVQCSTKTGYDTSPTSCTGDADSGSVSYSPFAGLLANADGEGLVDNSGVFGVLNYSLEVIGGNPGDVVPIDIETALQATPISIGLVFSEIGVTADGSTGVTICNYGCGPATSFTGMLEVNALSGTVYTNAVHLEVDVDGGRGGTSDFDGGTVSVDPRIYVDPSFPNASDYQILLSDGIGNGIPSTTGVPEPATWAMVLFGIGVVGVMARRRAWVAAASPVN